MLSFRKEKWASTLIEKFGEKNALEFANSRQVCPCNMLNKKCGNCIYGCLPMGFYDELCGCIEASRWVSKSGKYKRAVKKIILRRLSQSSQKS